MISARPSKPARRTTGLIALLLLFLAAVSAVSAQESQLPTSVATRLLVLDMQAVLRESSAVKGLQAFVAQERETVQAQIGQREAALKAADQALAREKSGLSPEDYQARRDNLAAAISQLQSDVQAARNRLDKTISDGMAKVQAALIPIVEQIAREKGADLVVSKALVILNRNELEVTGEVLRRLDATLPSLSNLSAGSP